MYDKNNIYALNKRNSDAIVYKTADDQIILLTKDDFETEADFQKWKVWSDENYHTEEKREHIHSDHLCQRGQLPEVDQVKQLEAIVEHRIERAERQQLSAETIIRVKEKITEKQFRRLWMYYVDGMTQEEIARVESVGQRRISESIMSAMKKIRKLLIFRQNSESKKQPKIRV